MLLVFVLAGCGSAAKPTHFTLAATRECARGKGQILKPKSTDFIATTATAGAFRLRFHDKNEVTVLFGANPQEASGLANGYRRFHAKNVGIEDILRTNGNAVMLWRRHPKTKDEATMTACLK